MSLLKFKQIASDFEELFEHTQDITCNEECVVISKWLDVNSGRYTKCVYIVRFASNFVR